MAKPSSAGICNSIGLSIIYFYNRGNLTMRTIIKIAFLSALALSDAAQCNETADETNFSGDLLSRSKLTGD